MYASAACSTRICETPGRVVIRYTEGSPVSVRYDPLHPHRCTLERRLSRLMLMFLAIGVFQVAAISGALMGWWD